MQYFLLFIMLFASSCKDASADYSDMDFFDGEADYFVEADSYTDNFTDSVDNFVNDPDIYSDLDIVHDTAQTDNFTENDAEAGDTDTCTTKATDFCKESGKCQNGRILLCSVKYDENNCPVGETFTVESNCLDTGRVCEVKNGTPECICSAEKWEVDGKCLDKITCPTYITTDETIKAKNTIASFNTLHLGWDNSKDFAALACIVNHFDVTGLVEVETEEGLAELTENLEKLSGKNWEYHISDKEVGEDSYKEFYGFVWNTEEVSMNYAVGFFPETANEFKREPYAAEFTMGTFTFTFAIIHVVFGDSITERRAEVDHLDEVYQYFQGLDTNQNDVIIGGDFNLPVDDEAFTILSIDNMNSAVPGTQLTTIGASGLVSAYDNILFPGKYVDEFSDSSGVLDFTKDNYSEVRTTVSDHLPVWIGIK